ncbi:MAG: Abi-alpha family protein [Thermacetogeniaceae bacterium]
MSGLINGLYLALMTDIGQDTAKEGVKLASEGIKNVAIPPLKEIGELLADKIRFIRWKNAVKVMQKAEVYLQEKKISAKLFNPKTIVPLLENAGLEEDSDIQAKWACLLANAVSSEYINDIYVSYVDILKQLSPLEVKLLDCLYSRCKVISEDEINSLFFKVEEIKQDMGIETIEFSILISNLLRLNLLQPPKGIAIFGGGPPIPQTFDDLQLSVLGLYFIKACRF